MGNDLTVMNLIVVELVYGEYTKYMYVKDRDSRLYSVVSRIRAYSDAYTLAVF